MLSVVINTYNHEKTLPLVLHGYRMQSDQDFEIVIADDGSSDKTIEIALQFPYPLDIQVCSHGHKGEKVATCFNRGAALAKGEHLLFTQGDVIPARNLIERHKQKLEIGIVTVGPMHLLPRHADIRLDQIEKESFSDYEEDSRIRENLFIHDVVESEEPWHYIWTSNCACTAKDFQGIGGFSEAYNGIWGGHDTDWAYRMHLLGCKFSSVMHSPVYHIWHPIEKPEPDAQGWIPAMHLFQEKIFEYGDSEIWRDPNGIFS